MFLGTFVLSAIVCLAFAPIIEEPFTPWNYGKWVFISLVLASGFTWMNREK